MCRAKKIYARIFLVSETRARNSGLCINGHGNILGEKKFP